MKFVTLVTSFEIMLFYDKLMRKGEKKIAGEYTITWQSVITSVITKEKEVKNGGKTKLLGI